MKKTSVVLGVILALATVSNVVVAGKESGEKGGTADINIGVGELQEDKSKNQRAKKPSRPDKPKVKKAKKAKKSNKEEDIKTRKGNVETEFKVEKGK